VRKYLQRTVLGPAFRRRAGRLLTQTCPLLYSLLGILKNMSSPVSIDINEGNGASLGGGRVGIGGWVHCGGLWRGARAERRGRLR
jgi:hypothetical protein